MADRKRNTRKRRKPDPFAVVRGKVVERVEVSTNDDDIAIGILFKDRTYLGFDLDPHLRITPDFSDWKTHNYKRIKRWPPIRTE
ncbi:MAG TPA: hypothetical protein VFB79_16245 [Candidatus Angelobacter sp.]|nr:hypothetical protein [Candidatus Angelobacter sp.]